MSISHNRSGLGADERIKCVLKIVLTDGPHMALLFVISGKWTAGLPGHWLLPDLSAVSFSSQGRSGPAATDRRDRGDTGPVRIPAGPGLASARGLARQP